MAIEAAYHNRLKDLQGQELIIEIMAQMNGFFHGPLEKITYAERFQYGNAHSDGSPLMDEVLIHAEEYLIQLIELFAGNLRLKSYGHLLKILSAAYANCIGKKKIEGHNIWFFYHMHMFAPDFEALSKTFAEDFKKIVQLYLIREPVRRLYSHLSRALYTEKANKDTFRKGSLKQFLLVGSGCYLKTAVKNSANIRVIRFEDLKLASKETMSLVCDWLGIPYNECLERTTVNGTLAYFAHYDEQGNKKYITGNDTSALQPRRMDDLFSYWDIARLELIYSKFKQAYGYEPGAPDFDLLDEHVRAEIFRTEFRFAPVIQAHIGEEVCEEDEFHYDVNAAIRQIFETFMSENQGDMILYPCISPRL